MKSTCATWEEGRVGLWGWSMDMGIDMGYRYDL